MYIHTYTYTHTCVLSYTYTHTYAHIYTHIHTHTPIHTYTHIHLYIHTYTIETKKKFTFRLCSTTVVRNAPFCS